MSGPEAEGVAAAPEPAMRVGDQVLLNAGTEKLPVFHAATVVKTYDEAEIVNLAVFNDYGGLYTLSSAIRGQGRNEWRPRDAK